MYRPTLKYHCSDCLVNFTVYSKITLRRGNQTFCPVCGDNVSVRRHNEKAKQNPNTVGTKPIWSDDQKKRLIDMYNEGLLSYPEIGLRVNKSRSSIEHMIRRLRKKGMIQ